MFFYLWLVMESEGHSIRNIEVSDKYVSNLIPVELKKEELYLKFQLKIAGRLDHMVDYPIGQLIIRFEE